MDGPSNVLSVCVYCQELNEQWTGSPAGGAVGIVGGAAGVWPQSRPVCRPAGLLCAQDSQSVPYQGWWQTYALLLLKFHCWLFGHCVVESVRWSSFLLCSPPGAKALCLWGGRWYGVMMCLVMMMMILMLIMRMRWIVMRRRRMSMVVVPVISLIIMLQVQSYLEKAVALLRRENTVLANHPNASIYKSVCCFCLCLSLVLLFHVSHILASLYLSALTFVCLSISICLHTYPFDCVSCVSIHLCLHIYPFDCFLCVCPSLSAYLSIWLCFMCVYPSLSPYLSIWLFLVCLSISVCISVHLTVFLGCI